MDSLMPELNTFTCKVCGVTKRDVNRWWIVWVTGPNRKRSFCCAEFKEELWKKLQPNPVIPVLPLPRDVACGEEHAQQLFARWLVSGSFDAPSQRPVTPAHPTSPDFVPSKPAHLAQPDAVPIPPPPTREEGSNE